MALYIDDMAKMRYKARTQVGMPRVYDLSTYGDAPEYGCGYGHTENGGWQTEPKPMIVLLATLEIKTMDLVYGPLRDKDGRLQRCFSK